MVSVSKEQKFHWDSLEDDRWILSHSLRHEIAGDSWYKIIKEHPSRTGALAFISVTSREHRWLSSASQPCRAKWSALLAAYQGNFYLPICGVSVVIILEWSHLFWESGAIGCRAVFPALCCKGHLLGLAVVIDTGTCPGQWLRDCKRRKLIPLHCSVPKYRPSQTKVLAV